ncbi:MAG: sensor histidine kinase [Clostridia bacterium]|nr:sensor histidine kinase [Clostridia bacterium]
MRPGWYQKPVQAQGPSLSLCGIKGLPYIFDRFYSTSDAANPHGTGLGLSIAREIARRHHARISASNRPEGGCTIEALFPSMYSR